MQVVLYNGHKVVV